MEITEVQIDRWLERGSKFFKTCARNPVVRGALLARGLTDDELMQGWKLYTELHGFGAAAPARAATTETAAAQALNAIDAWDAPAYAAARAVLEARFPEVASYLFENLEASVGPSALAGVERFLGRVAALRDGSAASIAPDSGKRAVELLAIRRIVDPEREAELRALIETARRGARPEEATLPLAIDPARQSAAQAYVNWLHEWREVARAAIARRDYQISLGLAQRRPNPDSPEPQDGTDTPPAGAV